MLAKPTSVLFPRFLVCVFLEEPATIITKTAISATVWMVTYDSVDKESCMPCR